MKKAVIVILALTLLVSAFALSSCNKNGMGTVSDNGLGSFASRDEIIKRINQYSELNSTSSGIFGWLRKSGGVVAEDSAASPPLAPTAENSADSDDYTRTNTQVEGVDEGDIIKADGANLYILNQAGFYIVGAESGQLEAKAEIKIENYVPHEMFVEGDLLVIIGGIYEPAKYFSGSVMNIEFGLCWAPATNRTDIRIYNIADRTAPVLQRQITVSGYYNTARLKDGTLYYITDYNFYFGYEDGYVPKIADSAVEGGKENEISPSNIKFFDGIPDYSYLITGKITLDGAVASVKAYLGAGGIIYVSENNIYAANYDYSDQRIVSWTGAVTYDYTQKPKTRIVRIAMDTLDYTGTGSVEGTLKDRYSLDEYDGNLRVATTTWHYNEATGSRSYSSVFVLNGDLSVLGKITDIAPNESIYSVRFNKEEGSLVTFRQMDPLYKLNLSDPANPTISEGLKKDGVSMYLHYIEGTDYVIGVGRDTTTEQNGGVRWNGLEVTLFDYSGAEAVVLGRYVIGDACSYAEALYNPKAILYDKDRNLFAFAAEEWTYNQNYYYSQTAQGLYVFGFEDGKLELRAKLTDIQSTIQYNDWYSYYDYSFSYIKRGARIGDYIYTISDRYVRSYSLADFTRADSLALAEYTVSSNGVTIAAK